ncbi:hypothetical protein FQN57_003973 [Myotisia sp. PD_48]|nr:hypothetical protein FQN57_003973 [Myotisia sp. PD_48]
MKAIILLAYLATALAATFPPDTYGSVPKAVTPRNPLDISDSGSGSSLIGATTQYMKREGPNPPPLEVRDKIQLLGMEYNGSGCDSMSIFHVLSDDRTAITLIYNAFELEVGLDTERREAWKKCSLTIRLKYPAGVEFDIFGTTYRGLVLLEKGGTATRRTKYYLGDGSIYSTMFNINGPMDKVFIVVDTANVIERTCPRENYTYFDVIEESRLTAPSRARGRLGAGGIDLSHRTIIRLNCLMARTPSSGTLEAFRLVGPVVALAGGEGQCVRVADTILKPIYTLDEAKYLCQLLDTLAKNENKSGKYQVAEPLKAQSGDWIVEGWYATRVIPGQSGQAGRNWNTVLSASLAFHETLSRLESACPSFIPARNHKWAKGDKLAWDEDIGDSITITSEYADQFRQLLDMRKPIQQSLKYQLVHADIASNILLPGKEGGHPPGIIDLTFYWRPAEYASAVLVSDGLLWFEAGEDLVRMVGIGEYRLQLLIRALIFRLVVSSEAQKDGDFDPSEPQAFQRAIDLINRLSAA